MHDSGIQKEMAVVGFFLSAGLLDYICICGAVGQRSQKGWKRAKELRGREKKEVFLMSI